MAEKGVTIPYTVGTMIELPRAALRAGEIAQSAQFFSFGTNDLTQTTFGISRDDAGQFLGTYERLGVMEKDPFVTLDLDGVGELVKIATERGKAVSADMKMGICGEHGGDPASIGFCETIGLDYVSCSPFRVPIARLAAAQAAACWCRCETTVGGLWSTASIGGNDLLAHAGLDRSAGIGVWRGAGAGIALGHFALKAKLSPVAAVRRHRRSG
jgi:phosphoenolpyruvate-protein kinase (PTS system EI component)